jgi:ligand-binding sensor domain-containing protein
MKKAQKLYCYRMMMIAIFNVVLCSLFAFISTPVYAQQELNFTSLSTKNGLSSNLVNAVLKDSYGWVWFATADGLNRFDGTNFTVYRHLDGDINSLPVNEILFLYEDKTGRLWVVKGGGSLVFYDRTHDTFHPYLDGVIWKKLQTEPILAISGDHLGRLWVLGYSGVRIIDLKVNKTTAPPVHNSKGPLIALGFFEDSKHRMWAGTNMGLLCFNLDNGVFKQYIHNDQDKKSVGAGIIPVRWLARGGFAGYLDEL